MQGMADENVLKLLSELNFGKGDFDWSNKEGSFNQISQKASMI